MPEKLPHAAPRAPRSFLLGPERLLWGGQLLAAVAILLGAYFLESDTRATLHPLLLLLAGLALLAALLPASGPRGQRIGLLPGIGLACTLLLPPLSAALPVLGASLLYAATRDSAAARRIALARGGWLTLAALVAGFGGRIFTSPAHAPAPLIESATALYAAVYLTGQIAGAGVGLKHGQFWRHLLGSRRLEIAGFAA